MDLKRPDVKLSEEISSVVSFLSVLKMNAIKTEKS